MEGTALTFWPMVCTLFLVIPLTVALSFDPGEAEIRDIEARAINASEGIIASYQHYFEAMMATIVASREAFGSAASQHFERDISSTKDRARNIEAQYDAMGDAFSSRADYLTRCLPCLRGKKDQGGGAGRVENES